MNEKIKLLELLRHEIDNLKINDSSLDPEILELMYTATSKDIRMDEGHEEMGSVLESLQELPQEAQAFMAAGLRAYRNMEIVRLAN